MRIMALRFLSSDGGRTSDATQLQQASGASVLWSFHLLAGSTSNEVIKASTLFFLSPPPSIPSFRFEARVFKRGVGLGGDPSAELRPGQRRGDFFQQLGLFGSHVGGLGDGGGGGVGWVGGGGWFGAGVSLFCFGALYGPNKSVEG